MSADDVAPSHARDAESPLPEWIGSYRIVRKLGEGGMGVVYEAEQEKPRRRVALKVLKPGFVTPELLRRFERESHVLGLLQHAGIAQIHEAGTADTGFGPQPFFAMELVDGQPIGRYAREKRLTLRQRLELVARVCDAVQHAHHKGIVHRDLKPGNILVVSEDDATSTSVSSSLLDPKARDRDIAHVGQPKVLDFGLARVTDADLKSTTIQTEVGQILGTVRYMSPEQVVGDPAQVDLKSDIYALGVVLYELLSGKAPHDVDDRPIFEAMRAIREDEPQRLSSLDRSFRGDVDTIVAKALEKDKARRYSSAADMAADIRRHLHDEPIVARPPSTVYQIRKFAARNRALVAGISATFAVLVLGIVATTWQAVSAVHARDEARLAATEANAMNDFFVNDMLLASDPRRRKGEKVTIEQVLANAASKVDQAFPDQPKIVAALRETLGTVFFNLGHADEAEPHLRYAYDTKRRLLGAGDPKTLFAMHELGRVQLARHQLVEAEALLRGEAELRARTPGADTRRTNQMALGQVLYMKGDLKGAEEAYTLALQEMESLPSMRPQDTALYATVTSDLALLLEQRNEMERALDLFDKAIDLLRSTHGELHPDIARVMGDKANLLMELGRDKEAEPLLQESLDVERKVYPSDHPDIATTTLGLGQAALHLGDLTKAETYMRSSVAMRVALLGEDDPETWGARVELASVVGALGRHDEAESLLRGALAVLAKSSDPDSLEVARAQFDLALVLRRKDDLDGAIAACNESLRIRTANPSTKSILLRQSRSLLAQLYHSKNDFARAEPMYRDVLQSYVAAEGEDALNTAIAHANLGMMFEDEGHLTDAQPELESSIATARKVLDADHPTIAALLTSTARVMRKRGNLDGAATLLDEALAIQRKRLPPGHPSTLSSLSEMGRVRVAQGRAAEAEPLLREVVDVNQKKRPEGDWHRAFAESSLGGCLVALKRYDEAEPLLLGSYAPLAAHTQDPEYALESAQRIVDLYAASGRPEKAEEWRSRAGSGAK